MKRLFALAVLAAALAGASRPAAADAPATMSREKVTGIIANSRKIVAPRGIERLVALDVNGATQWLSIRGRDARNPVLLVLHGGPGSPSMPEAWTFQGPWEDYFTVVEWDQRGTGKTYAANDAAMLERTVTPAQMIADSERVVQYLRATYHQRKIFVLGHSWGSYLGMELARRHPEWLYAYVGTGQIIDTRESERLGYEFAVREAAAHRNADALKELAAIAPYPKQDGSMTIDQVNVQRKWLTYYGGLSFNRSDFDYDADAWKLSPDYTSADLAGTDKGSLLSLTHLWPAVAHADFTSVRHLGCPVFLFEGRHDYTTSQTVAAAWFARLNAPQKKLVWFDDSAHMAMIEQPGRFFYHLVTDVRPLAR